MVKAGVPLFDCLDHKDTIWVYYPKARYEGGWVCDQMILSNGELRAVRAGLRISDRFLAGLVADVPPR